MREGPVYRHYEDEEFGIPPMGYTIAFGADLRGIPIVVRSDVDGGVTIELYPYQRGKDVASAFDVRLTSETRVALRRAGFLPWLPWRRVLGPHEGAAVEALTATLAAASGERFAARSLPAGLTLPWIAFVHHVLFADAIEGEVVEHGHRLILARCDGETHRVQCDPDTNEARVLAAWPTIRLQPW